MKKVVLLIMSTAVITACPWFSIPHHVDTPQGFTLFQTVVHPYEFPLLYQSEPACEVLEMSHFIIYFDKSHKIFAQEVAAIAESIYDDATSFMQCIPPEKVRIDILDSTIRFFPWESSFADRAYARSDSKSIILIYGCPFSTEVCGWNYGDVKRAVSYELNHVLLYWILGDTTYISDVRNSHQWIIAGLAAYYEQYTHLSIDDDFMLPVIIPYLDKTSNFPTSLEEITLENYDRLSSPLAASIIQYMFDVHGEEQFYTFLDNLHQWDPSRTGAQNVDRAFQEAFGTTKEEFEKAWTFYVKEKYQSFEAHECEGVQITHPPGGKVPSSWHGDKILFVSDINGNLDIFVMNADGTGIQQLTEDESSDFDPKFSPDGKRIAFTSLRKGYANIYLMNLDGLTITQVTSGKYMDFVGSWSPDGNKIVFTSNRSGNYDVYWVNADGSELTQVTTYQGDDGWPVFFPDSQTILFVSKRGGVYDLYTMNGDGTDIHQLTTTPEHENFPQVSPDGKKIVFISRGEKGSELCIMKSDGSGRETIVTPPNCIVDTMARHRDRILGYPVWSPDGDYVAFTAVNQIFMISVDHSVFWIVIPVIIIGCILVWGLRRQRNRVCRVTSEN
jgi:TolB protein